MYLLAEEVDVEEVDKKERTEFNKIASDAGFKDT
jgi:hypothetical protein